MSKFSTTLRDHYESEIQNLRAKEALTQKSLHEAFGRTAVLASTLWKQIKTEGKSEHGTPIHFQSDFSGSFYELVNITEKPTEFNENDRSYSFHPRLLLWKDKPTFIHAHPANGNLQFNDMSCSFFTLTAAGENTYHLVGDKEVEVASVGRIPKGTAQTDCHDPDPEKQFLHSFIPKASPLSYVKVETTQGLVTPHSVTLNLYNAAQPSQAAAGTIMKDRTPEVTAELVAKTQETVRHDKLKKLTLKKDGTAVERVLKSRAVSSSGGAVGMQ